jgi:hypothetical protein
LAKGVVNDPPPGYTVAEQPDGSVVVEGEQDQRNADGTTSHVKESVTFGSDGSQTINRTATNPDGSGNGGTATKGADGAGSSVQLEWDADGNVTKKTETKTDKDGKTTTTTTEYDHDSDGTITDTRTSTSTTQMPGEGSGFDPHNPACQQLMALDVMPGGNRVKMFNDLFKRPYRTDPRTVNPTPDQADSWSQEPFCGASGLGSNDPPAKCHSAVMCADDTYMDGSCQCKRAVNGTIALRGCLTAICPEGTNATAVGANACICTPDSRGPDGSPSPRPLPDLSLNALYELIWNRHDGQVFVTTEMARDHNARRGATDTPPTR